MILQFTVKIYDFIKILIFLLVTDETQNFLFLVICINAFGNRLTSFCDEVFLNILRCFDGIDYLEFKFFIYFILI